LRRPKRLPAKYAAMSATQTSAASASSSHGLVSRSTTNASHAGHATIQPAAAHVDGEGRRCRASQSGTPRIQKNAAMMKPVSAIAAKFPGTRPRYMSQRKAPIAPDATR
jgi:hypothetical protein